MIENLIFGVYLLILHFLVESLKTKKKLAKKITHIAIQFCSKNVTYFTNLNLLNIIKNILQQHSKKRYLLHILPKTAFSKHLESANLYILVNLLNNFFSGEVRNFYVVEGVE